MRGKDLTPDEEIQYLKSRVHYWEKRIVEASQELGRLEEENFYLKREVKELREGKNDSTNNKHG